MNETGFFKFVNRFNSLAFMVALIGVIGVLLYFSLQAKKWEDRRTVTVENGKNETTELILGSLEPISGGKSYYVRLNERESSSSYSSGGSRYSATRNVLFFREFDSSPFWLFESNDYLIDELNDLKKGGYGSKEPVIAFMYEIVYTDSNGNSRLDQSDRKTIAFSKSDGTSFTNVVENVDSLIGSNVSDDSSEIALLYQSNGSVFHERISLGSLSSLAKSEIKNIKKI